MIPFGREDLLSTFRSLEGAGIRSPLVPADGFGLKIEGALPTGSYKDRGAHSYFLDENVRQRSSLAVLSAGNLALATARQCRKYGTLCEALVPEGISEIKRSRLLELGAVVTEMPFEEIWKRVEGRPEDSAFLHPFHPRLLLGYATIAAELLEQSPDCRAVVVPFGLGGLATAVQFGLRVLRSGALVYACEIEGFSPLGRALQAGAPVSGKPLRSFIEAMGTPVVLPRVFTEVHESVRTLVVPEDEVRGAVRELYHRHRLRVEGAAAAAYCAGRALRGLGVGGVVSILSGSNISEATFGEIVKTRN